jgi:peptide chain release factor subunit 1
MSKSTSALETPLRDQLDRLASVEPGPAPVISLYLDTRPDGTGRRTHDAFLRRTVPERIEGLSGAARESVDADIARIEAFLRDDVRKSTNGLAIFACGASALFETVQLDVPLEGHELFLSPTPHLYPLARVNDQFPRYAALLVNTNSARLFVFGLGATEAQRAVTSDKTKRHQMGGWSQARFQRNVDNFRMQHMKEVVEMLDRVVREESLTKIVLACDEVTRPMLLEQMPKHLHEKLLDVVSLNMQTPEQEVLAQTMQSLQGKDAETDAEQVDAMITAWRSGGLGVAGVAATKRALEMGQVEELLITAAPEAIGAQNGAQTSETANELVTLAQRTSARIRFIENTELLSGVGGVGALLRFRI